MKDFCNFCRQSSDFSNIVCINGLEFNDHHGCATLVTEIINDVLPELNDATEICEDCLRTVTNFYQLKRDISLRFYEWEDPAEVGTEIKQEFEEFTITTSFNCDSIVSSVPELHSTKDIKISKVQSLSGENSRSLLKPRTKRTVAGLTKIKQENEDKLLIAYGVPMELERTKVTKYNESDVTDSDSTASESEPAIKYNDTSSGESDEIDDEFEDTTQHNTVNRTPLIGIDDDELRKFKAESEKFKQGFKCSICSKRQYSSMTVYRHMVFEHSRKRKLLEAWLVDQIRQSCAISGKRKRSIQHWRCGHCPKLLNSSQALRYHLKTHIIEGQFEKVASLTKPVDVPASKPPISIKKEENLDTPIIRTASRYSMRSKPALDTKDAKPGPKKTMNQMSDKDHNFVESQCRASKIGVKFFRCVLCSAVYYSYKTMYHHLYNSHVKKEPTRYTWVTQKLDEIRDASKISHKWPCCVCSKVSNSSDALRYHLKQHFQRGETDADTF